LDDGVDFEYADVNDSFKVKKIQVKERITYTLDMLIAEDHPEIWNIIRSSPTRPGGTMGAIDDTILNPIYKNKAERDAIAAAK